MEEVENQSSNEAVTQPETDAVQDVQADNSVQQESKDPHWIKNLRKERQELARENRMYKELLAQQMQQKAVQAPVQQEEDLIEQIQKEEYVPGIKVLKEATLPGFDPDGTLQA